MTAQAAAGCKRLSGSQRYNPSTPVTHLTGNMVTPLRCQATGGLVDATAEMSPLKQREACGFHTIGDLVICSLRHRICGFQCQRDDRLQFDFAERLLDLLNSVELDRPPLHILA